MEKRILIYTNHYYPENFKINDVVNWIDEQDIHVRVITQIPNYPSGNFFKGYSFFKNSHSKNNNKIINRLPVIPRMSGNKAYLILNYISYFLSCFFFTLYLLITKKKYNYIIVHHTSPPFISLHPIFYSLFHKTKNIYWELDIWPETLFSLGLIKSKIINRFIKKIMSHIYSHYDSILIGSLNFKEIIESRYNGNIQYFPNWADELIEENNSKLKVSLSIPDNHRVIMYTGNIGYAQNFEFILKLCNKTKYEKVYWVFIGDGRFKKNIKEFLKIHPKLKIKLIDQVKIHKIRSYIELSDYTLLSLSVKGIFTDTVPAKLQTYMCSSKPIIGIINGEAKDIILKANCGIILDSTKIDESTDKIIEMVKFDDEKIDSLGKNGKKYYDNLFNSRLRKNQILELIK